MTLRKIALTFILISSAFIVFGQEGDNDEMGGVESSAKMLEAKHEYSVNNMRGALALFREIVDAEADNSAARYWTAKCHYNLKKYDLAKQYVEQSVKLEPNRYKDINFFRGQIEHRLANLDEAIGFFERFIESKNKKQLIPEAQDYINQCHFAKKMMASPVDVDIKNMGDNINSRFDDYTPSITADGNLLLFTSRRSDTKGGQIDEAGDYKFFEDIYYSEKNEEGQWTRAFGIDGAVNTNRYDAVLSVSPSGDHMYLYKNNASSAGDIFKSNYKKVTKSWSEPEKLGRPINSSYFETSASTTSDGKTIYFISERPDGKGQGDIYRVDKKDNGDWGDPKNLGEIVNTQFDEKFVYIHPSGKTLFFASDGHQTMGSYDLFKTEFVNGQWSFPVNLGYPINTVNEESTFSLTKDNQTLLIAAEYEDSYGERDLYEVDISRYSMLSRGYNKSSYGTIELNLIDKKGKPANGIMVEFYYSDSDVMLKEIKSGKDGKVSINLPVNMEYRYIVHENKTSSLQEVFTMSMDESGKTLIRKNVELK